MPVSMSTKTVSDMDIKEFFKQKQRMCHSYNGCISCPIFSRKKRCYPEFVPDEAENIASQFEFVERWVREHPLMTNGQKLFEVFGVQMSVNDLNVEYHMRRLDGAMGKYILTVERLQKWLESEYKPPEGQENES